MGTRSNTTKRTWWSVVAFAAWTLFVWVGRVRNVWANATLDTAGKIGRSALAASFVVFGAATLAWALKHRRAGVPPRTTLYLVGPFAAWTVGVWVVRSAGIWVHEHPIGFKIVHTVLAAISIALAVDAVRRLRSAELDVEREGQAPAPAAGLEELAHG
jgi:hypothetical protein